MANASITEEGLREVLSSIETTMSNFREEKNRMDTELEKARDEWNDPAYENFCTDYRTQIKKIEQNLNAFTEQLKDHINNKLMPIVQGWN